jgi:LmbE family N-acetylglucosaminyl deacetylase
MDRADNPVLLVVVAHPDDETFGMGSVIANAALDGARVVVCCATRGEAGEDTSGTTHTTAELAAVRTEELHAAARTLGASEVVLLDFADSGMTGDMPPGALAAADIDKVVGAVTDVIERVDPDIVVTLDSGGVNDHRDHQRIGEATTIAFHRVARAGARLYHWTLVVSLMRDWLGEMKKNNLLDAYVGMELGRPDDEVTTIVDVTRVADTRRAAIAEHRTQLPPFTGISPELEARIFARDYLIRVVPPWDGGERETSLFR